VLRRPGRTRFLPARGWMRARRGDDGFTLLEMVVAISLLAIVAVAFAASVHLGFRTIALARQRQIASEKAGSLLEHLRSIPMDQLALSPVPVSDPPDQPPAYRADPTHPDHYVSTDGAQFDWDGPGPGVAEPLVFANLGAGELAGVRHVEDPIAVGTTLMEIYQYVTWVDDPALPGAENYKRITVVVRYKAPSVNGVNQTLRLSSLYADDTIELPALPTTTTPSSTTVASTTTTTTAATTTTSGSCATDTTPPAGGFGIQGGAGAEAGFTAQPSVTLVMAFTDGCSPIVARFRNEGGVLGGDVLYDPVQPDFAWSLTSGDGTKTVGGEVRDGAGNAATLTDVSIVLDTTKPTVPGTLARTVSCAGTNRTVTLSWGVSTDANFRSYRIYRNTGSGWSELARTDNLSYTDTHKKSLDTVQYYVVGYDKAGNQSDATNTIALAKNQCS
jgi:prepilin-type N-terminal cleavage/methylation domain-containing protein